MAARNFGAQLAGCACCLTLACGARDELPLGCPEAQATAALREPLALDEPTLPRTSPCAAASVDVTSYGAKGDGETDDIAAIQDAVNAAGALAAGIPGSCTVQVHFPAGTYHVTEGIFVPSRVALQGESRQSTLIVKSTEGSLIELGEREARGSAAQCAGVGHVSVRSLTLEMRASLSDRSKPVGLGGHCIRSPAGARYIDLSDLRLSSCNGYGIGLQVVYKQSERATYDCRPTSPPYTHVTIENVKIARAGSDGIDFKQPSHAMNDDILLRNVCVGDVGWNDDEGSAAGFDLAGNDMWLDTVTHVNPAAAYDTTGMRTYVTGIRFRSGERNVKNSVVENFHVQCVNRGIFFEGQDNEAVTLRNGEVTRVKRIDERYGDGIFVRGSHHRTEGDVYVTDVSRYHLVDYGTDSKLSLSSTAPAPYNPACDF